jgi:hypothetical protein
MAINVESKLNCASADSVIRESDLGFIQTLAEAKAIKQRLLGDEAVLVATDVTAAIAEIKTDCVDVLSAEDVVAGGTEEDPVTDPEDTPTGDDNGGENTMPDDDGENTEGDPETTGFE